VPGSIYFKKLAKPKPYTFGPAKQSSENSGAA